jgi:hypothetical protein
MIDAKDPTERAVIAREGRRSAAGDQEGRAGEHGVPDRISNPSPPVARLLHDRELTRTSHKEGLLNEQLVNILGGDTEALEEHNERREENLIAPRVPARVVVG